MTAQVIQRDKLGLLTKIGQGGQGVVYGAPNVKTKFATSMVYKEYKAADARRNRLHRTGRHACPGRGLAVLRSGRTADLDCRLAVCPRRRRQRINGIRDARHP